MPWQEVSVRTKRPVVVTNSHAYTRFFETEGIAILTLLMLRYKVEVMEEPRFASESFEDRKARVLSARAGLTLTYVPA
jgi:hypothetical protein